MNTETLIAKDRQFLWHPYSNTNANNPLFAVASAKGCRLTLTDGRELIDGMASWWCAVHGYNHPALNHAITEQLAKMAHVMFGGLTHAPAVTLAERLVAITPTGLDKVFLADSGSVSVEVALKMARQYWLAKKQPDKQSMLSFKQGYHGDTTGAMSVCDPDNGMHHLFSGSLGHNYFCAAPTPAFGVSTTEADLADVKDTLTQHHTNIAAVIIEPIVQGAGGMRFYSADFLRSLRQLCDEHNVLLIADEIATGFGRTGKLFACEHAGITPDILCLGKALTGGYMTLAATLCSNHIAETISRSEVGVLMHGPTFMGNPLACAVANASLDLLLNSAWQQQVSAIEKQLTAELAPLQNHSAVAEVRTLGAIGVVELKEPVNMQQVQPFIVEQGVWLRPFGKRLYTMPPFIITPNELTKITQAMIKTCDFIQADIAAR
ncbi:MAG: adenosylmethionine--8-amino-7-oxononanoate transaminase [Marinagarivorans sp.]|nr:adenosylmethionine--8-amino-7-oxononanoate transaminase [Marinagarivorans sp.]